MGIEVGQIRGADLEACGDAVLHRPHLMCSPSAGGVWSPPFAPGRAALRR
jgi:hypothetical protein